MSQRIIDLSHPLEPATPVLRNYPPIEIRILDSTDRREPGGPLHLNSSHIALGLHTGTHMDAPFHFYAEQPTIEQVPMEHCVGPATLITLPNHGAGSDITPDDLAPFEPSLRETGKAIVNTGWHRQWGKPHFFTEAPALTGEAAEWLVACGAHLIGVDFASVDRAPHPAHFTFLGNRTLIVENLTNLDAIGAARFQFVALPLKIVGRDGSPVRAMAMEI